MSTVDRSLAASTAAEGPIGALTLRLTDYWELSKPRIVMLELIVAGAAACLAAPYALEAAIVLQALAATALIAASASIGNQLLEIRLDARMPRTARRPLPVGRVSRPEALALAALGLVVGLAWLILRVNYLTAALGLTSWLLYVVVYTPLKTRSSFNTTVGAVAGAIPILMGWTAAGGALDLTAWSLAAVLFLWQFPHFMAIAWLYRDDYAAAGCQMLSVVDPSGVRSGVQAVAGSLALLPVSLIPAIVPHAGSPVVYALWAIALGAGMLALSIRFAWFRDETTARHLLRGSLVYLPAWITVLLMVSL